MNCVPPDWFLVARHLRIASQSRFPRTTKHSVLGGRGGSCYEFEVRNTIYYYFSALQKHSALQIKNMEFQQVINGIVSHVLITIPTYKTAKFEK